MEVATRHEARISQLQKWMRERDITHRAIAERIGVAISSVHRFLNSEDMPVRHHEELLRLGFPVELLPEPLDRKPGRKKLEPRFPASDE